jgi:hypothetical protein
VEDVDELVGGSTGDPVDPPDGVLPVDVDGEADGCGDDETLGPGRPPEEWPCPTTGTEPVTSACGCVAGTTPAPAREITTQTSDDTATTTAHHRTAPRTAARRRIMRSSSPVRSKGTGQRVPEDG